MPTLSWFITRYFAPPMVTSSRRPATTRNGSVSAWQSNGTTWRPIRAMPPRQVVSRIECSWSATWSKRCSPASSYRRDRLSAHDVSNWSINDYRQVFSHPQIQHRSTRVEISGEAGCPIAAVANPIRLSKTPIEYRISPPRLGQHTHEVLSAVLGKTRGEIDSKKARGVI